MRVVTAQKNMVLGPRMWAFAAGAPAGDRETYVWRPEVPHVERTN